jgi:hypothetical protein
MEKRTSRIELLILIFFEEDIKYAKQQSHQNSGLNQYGEGHKPEMFFTPGKSPIRQHADYDGTAFACRVTKQHYTVTARQVQF